MYQATLFNYCPSSTERRRVNPTIQVTVKVNPYFEAFTFTVTWIIGFTLLRSVEKDNTWKDTNDSFQLLSRSIERRRRVNPIIQITRKVNTSK